MTTREEVAEIDDEALFADGFDAAIIGWTNSWAGHSRPFRVVYDADKVIQILIEDGCTFEEAHEYFNYNVVDAYVGERTPVFIWRLK